MKALQAGGGGALCGKVTRGGGGYAKKIQRIVLLSREKIEAVSTHLQ